MAASKPNVIVASLTIVINTTFPYARLGAMAIHRVTVGIDFHEQRKLRQQGWRIRPPSKRNVPDHVFGLWEGGRGPLQARWQQTCLLQGLLPEAQATKAILVEEANQ